MVTKGIIKSIDLNGNTCTVHMPFFETAGNDPIVGTAIISNTPGSYNGYKVGDAVLVAFEDGSMDSPVVMGKLYLGAEAERADPRGVLNVETSSVSKSASMPADTKLAASIDNNIPNTTVPYNSLSSIANELNSLNVNVGEMDRDFGNKFKQTITDLDEQKKQLESTIEQTATSIKNEVVFRDSTDQVPEGEDAGFGWKLEYDGWRVYKVEGEDKTDILTVNDTGLKVAGNVVAEEGYIGKFIIGAQHNCELIGTEASGIYSEGYLASDGTDITTFGQEPGTRSRGIYIGTDGLRLGEHFAVDTYGNVTATSITISYKDIDGNDQTATNIDDAVAEILAISKGYSDNVESNANKYTDGAEERANTYTDDAEARANTYTDGAEERANTYTDDAEARANEYAEEKADGARDAVYNKLDIKDTTITVNGIATPVVLAEALWVNSAQINGKLTANQINTAGLSAEKIEVKSADKKETYFLADSTKPSDLVIGNFSVDSNSLKSKGKTFGTNGSVMVCTGSTDAADIGGSGSKTGWNFTAGTNFGVRTIPSGETDAGQSELYVNKGKIGGFIINENAIESTNGKLKLNSETGLYAIDAELEGTVTARKGVIAGYQIEGDTLSGTDILISPSLLQFSENAKLDFSGYLTFDYRDNASYMETTGEKDFIMRNRGGAGIRFAHTPETQHIDSVPIKLWLTSTYIPSETGSIAAIIGIHVVYLQYEVDPNYALTEPQPLTVWTCLNNSYGEHVRTSFNVFIPKTENKPIYEGGPTYDTRRGQLQLTQIMNYVTATPCFGLSLSKDANFDASTPGEEHYTTDEIVAQRTPYTQTNNVLYSLGSFCPNVPDPSVEGANLTPYVLGDDYHIWECIRTNSAPISSSDRRLKNTIQVLPDQYNKFFDKLRPVIFKYNNGTSDRFHTGFIAQEVEEGLKAAGIETKDFAGLCIGQDENQTYALRYEEFIALNTAQIQALKERVVLQEAKILELEQSLKKFIEK